jgi:hypothetical protein
MASLLLAALDGLVLQYLLAPRDTPSGEDLVGALAEWMAIALEQSAPVGPRRSASKPARRIGSRRRAAHRPP